MPKGSDWINFIYVNLGFLSQVFIMYYFTAINNIKQNWPKYRCNPIYMGLADNVEENFVYCIQNAQSSFMGYILEPITYITSNLSGMGSELAGGLSFANSLLSNIRNFFTSIVQGIFGVFLNIVISFQKIIIGIKDMIGKVIGIFVTLLYILDGSLMTMQSAWNGPPGQMVQALSGNCFHPETKIGLKNGELKSMKDLQIGDILENGSCVRAVMKLDNTLGEKLFRISGLGVQGEDIFVTGKHHVFNGSKFVYVENYEKSELQEEVTCSWFSNLITDDHKIQIGNQLFWDWMDQGLHENKLG